MTKTSLYIIFILAVLTAIVYFGDAPEQILGTSPALTTEVDAVPFAVARNTTTTHYQDNGNLSYTFDAAKLEHYRVEDPFSTISEEPQVFTMIDKPELVFYQNKEPWRVTASKGKITSSSKHIELWKDVLVKHIGEDGTTTTIATQKLHIDPVNKVAKTAEPVEIISGTIKVTGIGLDANFESQKLKLLSKVRGIYDPI